LSGLLIEIVTGGRIDYVNFSFPSMNLRRDGMSIRMPALIKRRTGRLTINLHGVLRLLILAIALMAFQPSAIEKARSETTSNSAADIHPNNVKSIDKLLSNCPSWFYDQENEEPAAREGKILSFLQQISTYGDDDIRAGIVSYANAVDEDPAKLAKIYLLTRYLFNVPKYVKYDPKSTLQTDFGDFNHARHGEYIAAMAPLIFDRHHRIVLDLRDLDLWPVSYTGPIAFSKDIIHGFDYCRMHYHRRPESDYQVIN